MLASVWLVSWLVYVLLRPLCRGDASLRDTIKKKAREKLSYARLTFSSSSAFFFASASAFLRFFSSSAAYPYLIIFRGSHSMLQFNVAI
jgi:hypothetical protein